MSKVFVQIAECILEGQSKKTEELVRAALDDGENPGEILQKGLLAGMSEVGVLFKECEIFVPEVLVAAKAMKSGLEILAPHLMEEDRISAGKIVLVTVKGDLHDIGVNLVGMMLEGAGYEVINIGMDVPALKILEAVKEHNPDILGMSAMLTTTMNAMKDTINALDEAQLLNSVKVMVGGAPVTEHYASSIGAYYASDASTAVDVANKLIKGE